MYSSEIKNAFYGWGADIFAQEGDLEPNCENCHIRNRIMWDFSRVAENMREESCENMADTWKGYNSNRSLFDICNFNSFSECAELRVLINIE